MDGGEEWHAAEKIQTGETFSYILNQWDPLCYYSDDGMAEADNNTAERALRAVYVFFGIDPEAYLRHILSVLPEWPSNRVDELLSWNVVLTNK